MPRKIEISHKTILFTFFVIGAILFLWTIRDIIVILFVAILITVTLNPIVRRLSKFKIPKALSVFIVYIAFFGILIVCLAGIIPALIDQTTNFAAGLPTYIENLHISTAITSQISNQFLARLGDVPSSVLNIGIGVVSNIFTILTILTFAFYLLMALDKLDLQLTNFIGEKHAKDIALFIQELELKLGGWARGQVLLMFAVGILNYIGLTILGIPYALPLGIFAGLMEIVPYAGPIIGAVPAIVIGFGITPVMGVAVTALAFLIQQLENYVLAPKIMQKSVGVPPIVTLLSLAIGLKLAGIVGVLISIPLVITLQILVKRRFLA